MVIPERNLNNILLAYNKKPPASDFFNSYIDLAEAGVLEEAFAVSIAPSTGLRNRLVHDYETVNNEKPIIFLLLNVDCHELCPCTK